nr:uncharacterized protein LOC109765755 isoform X3 [Aegilops tauschii subsp. strangulata]
MLCLQWSGAATKRVTIVRCSSRQSLLDLREKRNRRARWKNLVKNKMARMHSYMLHPHGIPQSLALPNSGLPRFGILLSLQSNLPYTGLMSRMSMPMLLWLLLRMAVILSPT